jgi:A/G-specific adenine glycosylase
VNAHLWEFPNVEVPAGDDAVRAQSLLESELGCALASFSPFTTVKHTITRYRITLEVFRGEVGAGRPHARAGQWVGRAKMDKLPFTSAQRRVLTTLLRKTTSGGKPVAR